MTKLRHKILVVDDSAFDSGVAQKYLSLPGSYEVFVVHSAEECMKRVNLAGAVDFILLDIDLGNGVSGLDVLTKIREKFSSIELPIIMVTGQKDSEYVIEALRLGANDYITKPLDFAVAEARIKTQLKLRDLSREATRLSQIEALHAAIITYNHEINTPLNVALLCLESGAPTPAERAQLKESLLSMADILKKMRDLLEQQAMELEAYAGEGAKMVKINKAA